MKTKLKWSKNADKIAVKYGIKTYADLKRVFPTPDDAIKAGLIEYEQNPKR